jgi:hypothetical protein
MSAELTLGELFVAVDPAVAGLPHLITVLDGDLLGKISHLTKTRPGLWPLPAPFDENDLYNETREGAPFADWGLALNQAEVLGLGRLIKDALFGANLMLMSAEIDEAKVTPLAQTRGQRLANGAWFTPGYQDLPDLPGIVELAGWVLIPVGPGRARALFVASPARSEWLTKLQEWCGRQGRDIWKVSREDQRTVLHRIPAPSPFREQAIRRRIDLFIGEMELWHDGPGEDLPGRIQERLEALDKLRADIARARPDSG